MSEDSQSNIAGATPERLLENAPIMPPGRPMRMLNSLLGFGDQIKAIVATAESKEELVNHLLELIVVRTPALGAVWLEQKGIENLQFCESRFANESLANPQVREAIVESAQASLAQGEPNFLEPKSVRGSGIVTSTLPINEATTGILSIFFHNPIKNGAELALVSHLICCAFDVWRGKHQLNQMNFELRSTASVLDLVSQLDHLGTSRESCFAIANQLKELLKCEEVAIGLLSNHGSCQVKAISSKSNVDSNSMTVHEYGFAFDEAITKKELTTFPAIKKENRGSTLAHKRLSKHLRVEAVISIPLFDQQFKPVGVVTLAGQRLMLEDRNVMNLVRACQLPLAASLNRTRQLEGGWIWKSSRSISRLVREKTGWVSAAIVACLFILLALPIHYRVSCECLVEPETRRFSVAPYDGLVEKSNAQPGDLVKSGDVIANMEGRELRYQLAGLEADRQKAIKKRDAHSANQEIPEMLMAEYERKRLDNKIRILSDRLANLEIKSPIDGIVLASSVHRKQNFPVSLGQELYEIAPLNPLRIEIGIPAEEVIHFEKSDRVKIRFDGFGLSNVEGQIDLIRPRSEIWQEKNVFIAEVLIDNSEQLIRPGMQGTARVIGGRKSLGWSVFHRPWERFVTAIGL